jgi:transcriptional regulator with XRE-family HTH domain
MASTNKLSVENTFAQRLRLSRARHKWTLEEMAAKLGCGRSYLSRLENEKATNPSAEFIRKIASVCGINEQWLALGKGKPEATYDPLQADTDFMIAFTIFAEQMGAEQLMNCIDGIVRNKALSESAKIFWLRMIHPWFMMKTDLETKTAVETKRIARAGSKKKPFEV